MSLGHNAGIVRDGLVFHVDMDNTKKSWKGKPTTNLIDPDLTTWSGAATRTAVAKSRNHPVSTHAYRVVDDNTGAYEEVNKTITVANDSGTYTISLYIEKPSEPTAKFGFNYGLSGGSSILQYTIRFNPNDPGGAGGTVEDLGTWWRWSFSFTNNSTGNTSMYIQFYPATGLLTGSDNNSAVGDLVIAGMQVEKNSFATPFVDGTRGEAATLLDISGQNNSTYANSLVYPSDGTFSFNGSHFLDVSNAGLINASAFTVDCFVKAPSTSNINKTILGVGNGSSDGFWFFKHRSGLGSKLVFHGWDGVNPRIDVITSDATPDNVTFHATITFDGTDYQLYMNGAANGPAVSDNAITSSDTIYIGRHVTSSYWEGNVHELRIYNRALSAAEINQNFNAFRGRYGI